MVENENLEFERIYKTIARVDVDEDLVLGHYWRPRNGYRADSPVEEVKKQLAASTNPINWIKSFVRELADAFDFVELFSRDTGEYPVRLRLLKNMALLLVVCQA